MDRNPFLQVEGPLGPPTSKYNIDVNHLVTLEGGNTLALPVKRMVLYKHGVGFIERGTQFKGKDPLKINFKKKDLGCIVLIIFKS